MNPKFPVYVPSRGRFNNPLTIRCLKRDRVPFSVVVEPSEERDYKNVVGPGQLLVLPWNGDDDNRRAFCARHSIENGGLIAARNWIKQHAAAAGYERHWQLDDNIRQMRRWFRGKRIACAAGIALRACEDFVERYENVAVAGLNYTMFAHQTGKQPRDPFWLNVHVYSCSLILNSLPYKWRQRYNDDTDFCLQALAGGWCTVLFNAFMCDKMRTMTVKGGNTQDLYQGDGRLKMARSLERIWPHVVTTYRRWQRPQHLVRDNWKKFDTPLKRKPTVDFDALEPNEYGMKLKQLRPIRSQALRELVSDCLSF